MQQLQQMRTQAANSQQSSQLSSANSTRTSAGLSPVNGSPVSPARLPNSSPSNPSIPQLVLPQLQNLPQAAASNIIQQIAQVSQVRQQPFTGTISLHNNQAKPSLSDLSGQIAGNRMNRLLHLASSAAQPSQIGTVSLSNPSDTPSAHLSAMNLPLVTAGLSPSERRPEVIHVHHHDTDDHRGHSDHSDHSDHSHSDHVHSSGHPHPASALHPHSSTDRAYQNLNLFESAIQPGSVVSFQSVLSKRKGFSQSEPVIKELPLNRISKYLERKKKKGKDRIWSQSLFGTCKR